MSGSHPALSAQALSSEWKEAAAPSAEPIAAEPLEQMLSRIVHEVKTPLGILLMGTDFLQKKLPAGDRTTARVIEDMRHAIARTDGIVRGLMELSSAESLDPHAEDLHALIEESLSRLLPEFTAKKLNVVRKFAAGVPPISVDRAKLQKALANILRNALEALSEAGTLTVQTLAVPGGSEGLSEEPTIHVIIRDNGRGIEDRFLRRVFEPFFTTDKSGRKSGLGLTIAQQIILSHRGNISVANCPAGGAQVSVAVGGRSRSESPVSGQSQGSANPGTTQAHNAL